jgi:hypothetical protein
MRPSDLVPSSILRRIDRVREKRTMVALAPLSREYVSRYGLEVRHGPFAGMRYTDGLEDVVGDLVAKLTGMYERELQPGVAEWLETGYEHLIDVGSAEGYYAVGLARALPGATVHAFDINPAARARCSALADRNGVGGRVLTKGECEPRALADFPERGVALLSDCEGAELGLLDPERSPRLRGWPIIVELHDFVEPTITATVLARFEATHEIELIEMEERQSLVPPVELDFASPAEQELLLSERPPGMRWAHLRPRGAG